MERKKTLLLSYEDWLGSKKRYCQGRAKNKRMEILRGKTWEVCVQCTYNEILSFLLNKTWNNFTNKKTHFTSFEERGDSSTTTRTAMQSFEQCSFKHYFILFSTYATGILLTVVLVKWNLSMKNVAIISFCVILIAKLVEFIRRTEYIRRHTVYACLVGWPKM